MDLIKAAKSVKANGPKRVIINHDGETTIPLRASQENGIIPTVVFLRDDGWTLGAPESLRARAEAQWANSWIAVMEDYPDGEFLAFVR